MLFFVKRMAVMLVLVSGMIFLSGSPVSASEPEVGVTDSITRLYLAVFDRAPDDAGKQYWVDEYMSGMSLVTIAESFMTSDEWKLTYGDVSNEEFVDLMYQNVLDRPFDTAGKQYWGNLLTSGTSRASILLGFSESAEFVSVTMTASPVAPPSYFPLLPSHSATGKRVVYSNSQQRVWWVDHNNVVVDSYLVSGKANTPSPGTYHVFSKSPTAWAGHDGITMKHMIRFTYGSSLAIGFHSIPRYSDGTPMQSEGQLGTHQSDGCIRQSDDKAAALYDWAEIGTTVVVTK